MELTATKVNEIFRYSLWREGEEIPEIPQIYEGVIMSASFNPQRLKEKETEIIKLLDQLSDDFKQSGGGGMSFMNMCLDRNQVHWGEHKNVDELFLLGNAIGKAVFLAPRKDWSTMFIGGLPYILILDK